MAKGRCQAALDCQYCIDVLYRIDALDIWAGSPGRKAASHKALRRSPQIEAAPQGRVSSAYGHDPPTMPFSGAGEGITGHHASSSHPYREGLCSPRSSGAEVPSPDVKHRLTVNTVLTCFTVLTRLTFEPVRLAGKRTATRRCEDHHKSKQRRRGA